MANVIVTKKKSTTGAPSAGNLVEGELAINTFDQTLWSKDSTTVFELTDHDNLTNYLANEHIDWTGASAGTIHTTNFAALQNIVEDTTPQLGADLDMNAFKITDTWHGRIGTQSLQAQLTLATEWRDLPVGSHHFVRNTTGTAGGAPVDTYGYFTKVANRDTGPGWGGLWVGYGGADSHYLGTSTTGAAFATWHKIYTDQTFDYTDYHLTATALVGDVTGTVGATVVGNDSHTHGANNLTGTTLATGVLSSSLTSVGTIGTGVWQGTAINQTYLVGQSGTNTGDNSVNTLYSGLVSNATHTSEVTGATALTMAAVAISNKTLVTAVATDMVLLWDATDSTLKRADVDDFIGGVGTVTNVSSGQGMNFTAITGSGDVTLGTPSALTASTTDALTSVSHTHSITGFVDTTGDTMTGILSLDNAAGGEMLLLQDTGGAGVVANPFIGFDDSAGTRQGYVGFGSISNADMYLVADIGDIRFNAAGGQVIFEDDAYIPDNISLQLGTSADIDMQFNATNFIMVGVGQWQITGFTGGIQAGTIDADFDAITGTSYGGITEANLVDKAATEAITGTWTLDGAVTTSDYGTGGRVKDGTDVARAVGFNVMPIYEIDVADTFDLAHVGMIWHKDAGGALSFTFANDATIPQGATWVVHNDDTENLTLAQSTTTIYWLEAGSAPAAGNVTIEQGGIVTVYKYSDTVAWAWGAKAAGGAAGDMLLGTAQVVTADKTFNDSVNVTFGTGNDCDMYFSGTDLFIDMSDGADFRLRGGAANDLMILANDDGSVVLYNDGTSQLGTQQMNLATNTSGANLKDHDGTLRDVGFNDQKEFSLSATTALTLDDQHAGGLILRTGTGTDSVTMAAGTSFPIGSMCTVLNHGTAGTLTISDGSEAMYVMDGSGTVADNVGFALAIGGVITIWRQGLSVYYVWGAGIP